MIFTPHVSGRGDVSHAFAVDVFVENLQHLLAGEQLKNVIEWERGYRETSPLPLSVHGEGF